LKILFVHNDYGRPSGEEHAIGTFESLLKRNGHDVLQFRKTSESLMNGSRWLQAKAFCSGIHSFRSAREIDRFLKAHPVDVVQLQNVFPFISPSVLPVIKKHKIPIVMRCPNYRLFCPSGLHIRKGKVCEKCVSSKEWNCLLHNCEGSRLKSLGYALRSGLARWRGSFTYNVNRFLVLSEFQKQKFSERGIPESKLEIIPNFSNNPIDSVTTEGSSESVPAPLGNHVSFVGRLADEKGIELFFQAAESLPDIPFAAAGDHSWVTANNRTVPANVQLRGFLNGLELTNFYRESRILCFPSQWYEGFPNVIITAMEHQKPIVASRIGAIPEIVHHEKSGLLHETTSLEDLVTCIHRLYKNPDECRHFGAYGRQRVQSDYHASVVYPRLLNIYQQVVSCD
jgi:glycosyltransferase involved in cell wall biosynthesis